MLGPYIVKQAEKALMLDVKPSEVKSLLVDIQFKVLICRFNGF